MKTPNYLANFDSATAMLQALANYLHGEDFRMLNNPGRRVPGARYTGELINSLPVPLREQVYIWSGRAEAVNPSRLETADPEGVAEWAAELYPKKKYPAIAIGSSNGPPSICGRLSGCHGCRRPT